MENNWIYILIEYLEMYFGELYVSFAWMISSVERVYPNI